MTETTVSTGRAGLLSVAALTLATLGCTPKHYYVMEYRVDAEALNAEGVSYPPPSAREVLRKARIVAFAPPDDCADERGSERVNLARARCGEVMAGLEEAAADAGFKVVSWQALRGGEPALIYAKQHKVDVLFEVNRLGLDSDTGDLRGASEMRFTRVGPDGKEAPLVVSEGVRQHCGRTLARMVDGSGSLLLDVKMVSVKDGQTLWHYRWVFSAFELDGGGSRVYYPTTPRSKGIRLVAAIGGAVFVGIGASFLLIAIDEEEPGAAVAGVVSGSLGGGLAYWGRKRPEPPGEVVCKRTPVADPFRPASADEEEAGRDSDRDRIAFERPGGADDGAARRLARLAAADFVDLLRSLRGDSPRPTAARSTRAAKAAPVRVSATCRVNRLWYEQGKPGVTKATVDAYCATPAP